MAADKTADSSELNMDVICRFSGHLAHELNNLLTPIIACGQMLREGIQKSDPLYFCAEQVAEAGDRCLALSRKLQIIGSRRTSGHVMDLTSLVHEALKTVTLPTDRTIRLVEVPVEASDAARMHVRVDMEQFIYLIQEMVANAAAAMPQNGSVSVSITARAPGEPAWAATSESGWACLSIRDGGTGIAPEVQARMFEPYYSTQSKEKDKGLGLTLVYGIVRRAGGYIECESAPGEGAEFRLFFPLRSASDIK